MYEFEVQETSLGRPYKLRVFFSMKVLFKARKLDKIIREVILKEMRIKN